MKSRRKRKTYSEAKAERHAARNNSGSAWDGVFDIVMIPLMIIGSIFNF